MPLVWEPGRKGELVHRLAALQSDAKARWGQFTPARMVEHCTLAMKAALGEIPVQHKTTPLGYFPLKQLVIHVLPWPKGVPTAPELLPAHEPDLEPAKREFEDALARFVEAGPKGGLLPHVAFGHLSPRDWGALTYRHIDHHWRQFGI